MGGENIHIIGATLRMVGPVRIGGEMPDIADWTAAAALRGPGFLQPFVCSLAWDATQGCTLVTLEIGATEQAGWRAGRAWFDVRLISPDDEVLVTTRAFLVLQEPVTK